MAIFIGIPKNQSRLEAGIRKDREACFGALRLPGAFVFERGYLWKKIFHVNYRIS